MVRKMRSSDQITTGSSFFGFFFYTFKVISMNTLHQSKSMPFLFSGLGISFHVITISTVNSMETIHKIPKRLFINCQLLN